MEEARKEAEFIEKDVSRTEFTIEDLKKFSHKDELERYQRNCPILVACIIGSISRSKVISPGVCGLCQTGYSLLEDRCIECNITNCVNCAGRNTCDTCV